MSAYSDWRCGAITDEEYKQACAEEARRDEVAFLSWLDSDEEEEAEE